MGKVRRPCDVQTDSRPVAIRLARSLAGLLLLGALAGCQARIDSDLPLSEDGVPFVSRPAVERDLAVLRQDGVLRVITHYNSSNYFIHKGGQAGFDFELIRAFAREHGLGLEVVVPEDGQDAISLLNTGAGDVICTGQTPNPRLTRWVTATRPTNFVHKVVVQPVGDVAALSFEALNGLTLTLPAGDGFRTELLGLKADRRLHFFVGTGPPGMDPEELLELVNVGRLEAVVVDDIIAKAAMVHLDNLQIGAILSHRRPTAWFVRENCPELKAALNTFLQAHIRVEADGRTRRSETYGIIYDRYFENPLTIRRFREVAHRPDLSGTLSDFDDVIRARAEAAGFDWRLIAAQIFQESRFNPYAVSRADARGLMQVLPQFAGEQADSLFEPGPNLTAGLRLLSGTWQSYAYLDSLDRLRFTLAEFHAGHGHVTDARRIAMEMGRDPNRWDGSLAETLPRLMEKHHFSRTRHGFYGGAETVEYVEQILHRYRMYTRLVPRHPDGAAPGGASGPRKADLGNLPRLQTPLRPR